MGTERSPAWRGPLRRGTAAAALLCLALTGLGARRAAPLTAIAIQPLMDPAPPRGGETEQGRLRHGAPLVAHLVLTMTPGMQVRWRPVDPGGPGVLSLFATGEAPPPGDPARAGTEKSPSPHPAIAGARRMLESLPLRRWRKRSLKRLEALELESLDAARAGLLVDALAARARGEPGAAAGYLMQASGEGAPPIIPYLLAISRMEEGDLAAAASAITSAGERLEGLPGPVAAMARAVVAARKDRKEALSALGGVLASLPSLAEAYHLRARLSRDWCDLYDQRRILSDLDGALGSQPCCPGCALGLAEMLAFTDRPDTAPSRIRSDAGCAPDPLDSARDRALALAFAASGSPDEALRAASRAESREVSPLSHGLAPALVLAGDRAHLVEAHDAGADPGPEGQASVERHLYAGIAALGSGRPSRAAVQFERAEQILLADHPGEQDIDSWVQLVRTLRIRAHLTAGRADQAQRAAEAARAAGRGRMNGLLIYTAGLADIAAGDRSGAISETRRLTLAAQKFWRYLLTAELALQEGKAQSAQSALSLASQGVNLQTTVCPGVSVEPYFLHSQAKALLALQRPKAAEQLLGRLLEPGSGLGSRALFAPDLLGPSWELLAQAREARRDAGGAAEAYREILRLWGEGEEIPLVARARRELARLEGD